MSQILLHRRASIGTNTQTIARFVGGPALQPAEFLALTIDMRYSVTQHLLGGLHHRIGLSAPTQHDNGEEWLEDIEPFLRHAPGFEHFASVVRNIANVIDHLRINVGNFSDYEATLFESTAILFRSASGWAESIMVESQKPNGRLWWNIGGENPFSSL